LVEGATPCHFFTAATRHLGIADALQILDYGGITELVNYLTTLAANEAFRSKVESIGIVRDAEGDALAAATALENAIQRANIPAPVRRSKFILPDNVSAGNIESLCLRSVATSPVMDCVNNFINCAAEHGIVWADGYERDKALVQVFASTRDRPYAGLAAYKGAWPWDSPVFADLFAFLQAL